MRRILSRAKTREVLRRRDPEVIGLRDTLVSPAVGGAPSSTLLEASWLYTAARDEFAELPLARTVIGKLRCLDRSIQLLSDATARAASGGLSADDLVPLVILLLVASRFEPLQLDLQAWALECLSSDLLASGRVGYCMVTLQVAIEFLRHLDVDGLDVQLQGQGVEG